MIVQIKKMVEILSKIWFIYNQIYTINITEMASSNLASSSDLAAVLYTGYC